MDTAKVKEFKKRLHDLLKEYDVMIGFSVSQDSDVYGLHNERIVISTRTNRVNKTLATEIISADGWWMDHTDLR